MDDLFFSSIKFSVLVFVTTLFLSSCGSGGSDEEDELSSEEQNFNSQNTNTDTGTNTDTDTNIYVAVRAINYNEESSGFSNEASTLLQNTSEVKISFNEPSIQMDGSCLTSQISRYIVHYGNTSGSYTDEISINRDSAQLTCTIAGTHAECGNITNCTTTIAL